MFPTIAILLLNVTPFVCWSIRQFKKLLHRKYQLKIRNTINTTVLFCIIEINYNIILIQSDFIFHRIMVFVPSYWIDTLGLYQGQLTMFP